MSISRLANSAAALAGVDDRAVAARWCTGSVFADWWDDHLGFADVTYARTAQYVFISSASVLPVEENILRTTRFDDIDRLFERMNRVAGLDDGSSSDSMTEHSMRSVSLPVSVDPERGSASYTNGVLTVTLPKLPGDSGHRIDIN